MVRVQTICPLSGVQIAEHSFFMERRHWMEQPPPHVGGLSGKGDGTARTSYARRKQVAGQRSQLGPTLNPDEDRSLRTRTPPPPFMQHSHASPHALTWVSVSTTSSKAGLMSALSAQQASTSFLTFIITWE